MPIDSSRYSNTYTRHLHNYADKYQDIAPQSFSTTSSWSSTPTGAHDASTKNGYEGYRKLTNTRAKDLNAEMHLAGAATNPRNPIATVTTIKKPDDLNIAKKPNTITKFVVTGDGQMVVANINKNVAPKMVSHPAVAEMGAGAGQSSNVVSAGYLKQTLTGKTYLSNTSGHYQPAKNDMKPAKYHLEKIGVKSTNSKFGVF
ncbi:hypothetical protein [Pseudomonas sp. EL_65y_Pfl1_R83]|uniref:hypothetical protein n=1 Tax=Pseudomonas sp. EL_65y_Pfl1_R83 TaxID=3088697 RepID=UPI0030D9BD19